MCVRSGIFKWRVSVFLAVCIFREVINIFFVLNGGFIYLDKKSFAKYHALLVRPYCLEVSLISGKKIGCFVIEPNIPEKRQRQNKIYGNCKTCRIGPCSEDMSPRQKIKVLCGLSKLRWSCETECHNTSNGTHIFLSAQKSPFFVSCWWWGICLLEYGF